MPKFVAIRRSRSGRGSPPPRGVISVPQIYLLLPRCHHSPPPSSSTQLLRPTAPQCRRSSDPTPRRPALSSVPIPAPCPTPAGGSPPGPPQPHQPGTPSPCPCNGKEQWLEWDHQGAAAWGRRSPASRHSMES